MLRLFVSLITVVSAMRNNVPKRKHPNGADGGRAKRPSTDPPSAMNVSIQKTPYGTPYADECPAGRHVSSPSLSNYPTNELNILTWNVEWAFSPRSKRVTWIKEVVEPAGDREVLRCPQDMFELKNARKFRRGHPCYSQKDMDDHLRQISDVLAKMDPKPHIININEVDGCTTTAEIGAGLPGYAPYVAYNDDDRTTEQVSLLSSIPLVGKLERVTDTVSTPVGGNDNCNVDMGAQGLSKHYIAKFDIPGKLQFYMIGLHLKSMRQDNFGEACSIREAEATVLDRILRRIFDQEPTAEVLVLGDFNDFDPDVLDRRGAIYHERHGQEFPTGQSEDCTKLGDGSFAKVNVSDEGVFGQKSRTFQIIKGAYGGRPMLENLMGRIERKRRYSHKGAKFSPFKSRCGTSFWHGHNCGARRPGGRMFDEKTMDPRDCSGDSLLDYVLASPRLAKAVKTIRILNDDDFSIAYSDEYQFSKRFYYDAVGLDKARQRRDSDPQSVGFTPSDHFPVSLTIDLNRL